MGHTAKFLAIAGSLVLAAFLPGCALLIPENPSAPRYNTVLGPPRAPALNMTSPSEMPHAGSPASFPPVAPATQARAQEIIARDVQPMAQTYEVPRSVPEENRQAVALTPDPIPTAPVTGMPMTVAATRYPDLHNVPPKPETGTATSNDTRLNQIRQQLEYDRMQAEAEKARLANDAAAEPSLLDTTTPAPVNSAPLPPPPTTPMPPSSSTGPIWSPMASAPTSAPLEPIILRPPVAQAAPAPAPLFAPTVNTAPPSMAPAMAGGFNPMAGSASSARGGSTTYAADSAYLPPSRYSNRRF